MFSLALLLALPLVASATQHAQTRSYPRDAHASLARRDTANQIPIACAPGGANVKCKCPTDLFGDSNGVEINVYPGSSLPRAKQATPVSRRLFRLPVRVPERRVHMER
jgi:hypothetical protein